MGDELLIHRPQSQWWSVIMSEQDPELERLNVLPRQRGKETRAALIAQVGDGRFILAEARFKPNAAQLTDLAALADMPSDEEDPSESIDDVTDLPADGDVALPTEGQERPSVAPLDVAVPAAA